MRRLDMSNEQWGVRHDLYAAVALALLLAVIV